MPKKVDKHASNPLNCLLAIKLEDLPKLQVWSLPLAREFDLSSSMQIRLPAGISVSKEKLKAAANNYFLRLKINAPSSVIFSASKVHRLDWAYLRKMLGGFVEQFAMAPDGTEIVIQFGTGNKAHRYQGQVDSGRFMILETTPALSRSDLEQAWQLTRFYGGKSIQCADETEADAFEAAWPKYKSLRDEIVTRKGLQFSGQDYSEHLAGCLFQLRHATAWQLPELRTSKRLPKTPMQKRAESWQREATPPAEVAAIYDHLCTLINDATKSKLKARNIQQLPPKREWSLPTTQTRRASLEFITVAAMASGIIIRMPCVQCHHLLNNRLSNAVKQLIAHGTQAITPEQWKTVGPTIQTFIVDALSWFQLAFIDVQPTPGYPIQPIGEYIFELHAPAEQGKEASTAAQTWDDCDQECTESRPIHDYDKLASWHSVSPSFHRRLVRCFGSGTWKRAELQMQMKLFDWDKPFTADIHWYAAAGSSDLQETWRMKSFSRAPYKLTPLDMQIECVTPNAFRASLQVGKSYRCTARIGEKYTGYLRVVDESGQEYWYPETFFRW